MCSFLGQNQNIMLKRVGCVKELEYFCTSTCLSNLSPIRRTFALIKSKSNNSNHNSIVSQILHILMSKIFSNDYYHILNVWIVSRINGKQGGHTEEIKIMHLVPSIKCRFQSQFDSGLYKEGGGLTFQVPLGFAF